MKTVTVRTSSFTLLELVVSMSLLSLLLAVLLGAYWNILQISERVDVLREDRFRSRLLHCRLAKVMPRTLSFSEQKEGKTPLFYTEEGEGTLFEGQSLVFTYDNGDDIYPWYSNGVLGRLYLTPTGQLMLAKWPYGKEFVERRYQGMQEVLLDKVQSLSFEFYAPPKRKQLGIDLPDPDDENVPKYSTWQGEWRIGYKLLPAIVKVHVTYADSKGKKRKKTLAFPLVNSDFEILFREG